MQKMSSRGGWMGKGLVSSLWKGNSCYRTVTGTCAVVCMGTGVV